MGSSRVIKTGSDVEVSPLMAELRERLDAEGIPWCDVSDELSGEDYVSHFERTKVFDQSGKQLASCIYGYNTMYGKKSGSSYGWPGMLEGWMCDQDEPVPMTVDEIMGEVSKLWRESLS